MYSDERADGNVPPIPFGPPGKKALWPPTSTDPWAPLSSPLGLAGQAGTAREPETSLARNLTGRSQEGPHGRLGGWPPAAGTRPSHGVGLSRRGSRILLLLHSVRVEPNRGRRVSEPRFGFRNGLSWRELRQADASVRMACGLRSQSSPPGHATHNTCSLAGELQMPGGENY